MRSSILRGSSSVYNEVDRFTNERLSTTIGAIGLPRLARSLLTLIGSWRIYYVFKIKARLPFNILFLKVQFALKKVESSATPLLTIYEVEKVQHQKIASFIGHVFQLTNAVLIDKLIQQEKVNHCNGLKTLYFNFV